MYRFRLLNIGLIQYIDSIGWIHHIIIKSGLKKIVVIFGLDLKQKNYQSGHLMPALNQIKQHSLVYVMVFKSNYENLLKLNNVTGHT